MFYRFYNRELNEPMLDEFLQFNLVKMNWGFIAQNVLIFSTTFHVINSSKLPQNSTQSESKEIDGQPDDLDGANASEFATEEFVLRGKSKIKIPKASRVGRYQVVVFNKDNKPVRRPRARQRRPFYQEPVEPFVSDDFFNQGLDHVSEISSVADEVPKFRPHVTDRNANGRRSKPCGRHSRLLQHLSTRLGDFDHFQYADGCDVLSAQIRASNLYSHDETGFDGFSSMSLKERQIHRRRNPSIHPHRAAVVRENEIDPDHPYYEEDVKTSQKDMQSFFGRYTGRDRKPKLLPNRDSFSSVNDGCVIC